MKEQLKTLALSLVEDLTMEETDLDLFAWAVEDEWTARVDSTVEYYRELPHLMIHELREYVSELDELERFFADREEYERCAAILQVREKIWDRCKPHLGIK
jgi:hypothetical protein